MKYEAANITTAVMIALVVWQAVARFRCEDTSSWPLVFYGFLLGYHQSYPDVFQIRLVLAATSIALLLRYEFLGRKVRTLLVVLELAALAYFIKALFAVLIV
jgi:hypothetical protein